MATSIYLGNPPANIKKWIEEHVQTGPVFKAETQVTYVDGTTWEGLIEGTMDCPTLVAAGLMPEGSGTMGQPDWIKQPKEVIIGNKVTNIDNFVFDGRTSLTSISIPDSVTRIGTSVFSSCVSLTSIAIPNSVTSIDYGAFNSCRLLTTLTIPSSVTNIGMDAFYGCTSLTSLIFEGKTLEEVQGMNNYPWGITDTSIIKIA